MLPQQDMNSVDIAMQRLRELRSMFFDPKNSPQDYFNFTQKHVISVMEDASREIKVNYEEVSATLTAQMNTGKKQ